MPTFGIYSWRHARNEARRCATMFQIRTQEYIILGTFLVTLFSFFFAEWWMNTSGAILLVQPETPRFFLTCLLAIAGALAVQAVVVFSHINRPTETNTFLLLGSALVMIGAALVVIFRFEARQIGVWLVVGMQTLMGWTVWTLLPSVSPRLAPKRDDGLHRLLTEWESYRHKAQQEGKQFAILSVHTPRSLTYAEREMLRLHLRLQDTFLAVRDGLWVLIWDTDYHGALRAAEHIQTLLRSSFSLSSRIGMGLYQADGETLAAIAMAADQAVLQTYEEGAGLIAAATPPDVNDAALFLRRRWAPILVEALQADIPVSVLAARTSRRLSLYEIQSIKNELRARDEIFPVREGFFLLLWRASREEAHFVAKKVRALLVAQRIDAWIGVVPDTFVPAQLGDNLLQAWHLAERADDEQPVQIASAVVGE